MLVGRALLLVALTLSLRAPAAWAQDEPSRVPDPRPAHEVIARGRAELASALAIACSPAWRERARPRPVTIVVDPVSALAAKEEEFVASLVALEARAPKAVTWSLAALGARPGRAYGSPSMLGPTLRATLTPGGEIRDTLGALARTARAAPVGAVVVYVAAVHFEDERLVEDVARALVDRGQTLSLVGPEAGFQRAWNDGLFTAYRGHVVDGVSLDYDPNVGRQPFAADDPIARGPLWHGPETALPLIPTYFSRHWDGRLFTHRYEVDAETGERVRRTRSHPYPSGWGPWALMRLASVTGGRYVSWSTQTSGEVVSYDGARLDLLPPSLAARRDVLAAARERPLRAETIRVWGELTDRTADVFRVTPAVRGDLETPIEIVEPTSRIAPPTLFYEKSDHERFRRACPELIKLLDAALRRMDRAIARAAPPRADAARRDLADARLVRHVLLCERFSWGEAWARGRRLMPRPWRDDGHAPSLRTEEIAERRPGGKQVEYLDVEVTDEKRRDALLADRRFLIETYAGTPWGEMVARNRVVTRVLVRARLGSGVSKPRTGPVDSDLDPADTTPSGGATGPATGD